MGGLLRILLAVPGDDVQFVLPVQTADNKLFVTHICKQQTLFAFLIFLSLFTLQPDHIHEQQHHHHQKRKSSVPLD
jgi:hypothetical protein